MTRAILLLARASAATAERQECQECQERRAEPRAKLTASQVAKMSTLSRRSVYRAAQRGELPHTRRGGRIFFDPDDVARFIETTTAPSSPYTPRATDRFRPLGFPDGGAR